MPECRQHTQAVDAGQHPVKDDEVVVALGGHVKAIHAVGGGLHHEALLRQALAEVGRELGLVFDQQQSHGAIVDGLCRPESKLTNM